MSSFVIVFALIVFAIFIYSVAFLGWAIFFKIPNSYKKINFFKLIKKEFLHAVPNNDKEKLLYVRKGFFGVLYSLLFLVLFIIVMKTISLSI